MIQFVQTGEYRTKSIRIKRFVNGVESVGNGFPFVVSLLDDFGNEPRLSDQQLMELTAISYQARVEALKTHLISTYSFLSIGDFANVSSGVDNLTCVPGQITSSGSIVISQDTDITIFFDATGSMSSALSPLLEMRNTLLKTALLPFYNMDSVIYDQRVKIISDTSERTFHMLNNRGSAMASKQLMMVFQDESNPAYHTSAAISPITNQFEIDIAALKATMSLRQPNTYRGIIFQVTRIAGEGTQFKNLITEVQNGSATYVAPNNLVGSTEIAFQYDVNNNQTPQYYLDLIILKMRELGYRI